MELTEEVNNELTKQLETWVKNNPGISLVLINSRPKDMNFELYKEVRKSAKQVLKFRKRYGKH